MSIGLTRQCQHCSQGAPQVQAASPHVDGADFPVMAPSANIGIGCITGTKYNNSKRKARGIEVFKKTIDGQALPCPVQGGQVPTITTAAALSQCHFRLTTWIRLILYITPYQHLISTSHTDNTVSVNSTFVLVLPDIVAPTLNKILSYLILSYQPALPLPRLVPTALNGQHFLRPLEP